MAERKLARRYAKSLHGLAQERGIVEEVFNDMSVVSRTCAASRELSVFLKNPIVHADKKDAVIRALFQDKLSQISFTFLEIITRKRRERHLEEIAVEFVALYKAEKGISPARIFTLMQCRVPAAKTCPTRTCLTPNSRPTTCGSTVLGS